MGKDRIQYIDVAKFLAMLLVVFSHGFRESACTAFIFSFHLPLFFFLNGMTVNLDKYSFGDFLVKKLKGYIVPMLGLGVIAVLFDLLVKTIINQPVSGTLFLTGLGNVINQARYLALWFLPALFFADLFLYGFNKISRGNPIFMGIECLLLMGVGILFNQYHNVTLTWNVDTAFFGTTFVYLGYLLRRPEFERLYSFLMKGRPLPLILGLGLLVATYFLSMYIYETDQMHLEMYARKYGRYYLTLPCAALGSAGFVFLCRGITNFALAVPVQLNLALLPFHQVLCFPIFRHKIAYDWWVSSYPLPASDPKYFGFVLTMTVFSLALVTVVHFILKYSPISFVVNQPLAGFYRKKSR